MSIAGRMAKDSANSASKQPRRPHFIEAWADLKGVSQAQLARDLDVDKSLVSRWYAGSSPGMESQKKLAAYFGCEPDALFQHPNADWIRRFLDGRSQDEIDRIRKSLELIFPRTP